MKNTINVLYLKENCIKVILKNKTITIAFLSLFCGSLYSIYLIGSNINPTNIDWLFTSGDPIQHFLGWVYFRNGSWHWPLTFTEELAYPTGASIAYTDSIPILAVLFKLFSGLLPDRFQYFGLFILLSFILQFFWGAKLGLLFTNSIFCATAAGLFFMFSPPLTWRIHGHIALTSHWLIVAGIWSYFYLEKKLKLRKNFIFQVGLIVLSSGVNPYLCVMTLSLFVISYLNLLLKNKVSLKITIVNSFTLVFLMMGCWLFWGYFSSDSSVGSNYGFYSLNLLSPIDPRFYSIMLKPLPIQEGQYEGFNYLGLGAIILFLTNLKSIGNILNSKKYYKKNFPILMLCLILVLFSLSNKIFMGDIHIISYGLPSIVDNLFGKFRASGRFFWPVHYLILLGLLVTTFKCWTRNQVRFILTILVCIQFIDLIPLHQSSTKWIDSSFSTPLVSEEWNQLSTNHNKLIVIPSHQCGGSNFPFFEKLAAFENLKINSFYLARFDKDDLKVHCEELPRLILSNQLESDAAYVFDKSYVLNNKEYLEFVKSVNNNKNHSHVCLPIDEYILCRKNKYLSEKRLLNITPKTYSINTILNFNKSKNSSLDYQFGGWSSAGSSGTWTDGSESHVWMQIQESVSNDLILRIEAEPFINQKHSQQIVEVLINNELVDKWVFQYGESQPNERTSIVKNNLIGSNSVLLITFRFLKPTSPAALGLSTDNRLLGLHFRKLQLIESR
jgi:hypothetical protein